MRPRLSQALRGIVAGALYEVPFVYAVGRALRRDDLPLTRPESGSRARVR